MARKLTTDMPMAEMMAQTPLSRYSPGQMAKLTADERARMTKRTSKKASPGADLTASTVLSAGRS